MKLCDKCDNHFTPKVSYQIYCSSECRDAATKDKIAERYHVTRRQKRIGRDRRCLGVCKTALSNNNNGGGCANCNVSKKSVDKMLKELKGFVDYEQE